MGSTSARLVGGMAALVLAGAASGTAIAQDAPAPVAPDPEVGAPRPAPGHAVPHPDPPPQATILDRGVRAAPVRRPSGAAPASPAAPAASARPSGAPRAAASRSH